MNNKTTTLLEQLNQRSIRDLLLIAKIHHISYADGLSRADCYRLIRVYDGDMEVDADFYMGFSDGGELWDDVSKKIVSEDPDNNYSDDVRRLYKLRHEIGNQLGIAESEKNNAAERFISTLLDPKTMSDTLRNVSDTTKKSSLF